MHIYANFPRSQELQELPWIVYFFINYRLARILFDFGTCHPFIAQDFESPFGLTPEVLKRPHDISSLIGKAMILR